MGKVHKLFSAQSNLGGRQKDWVSVGVSGEWPNGALLVAVLADEEVCWYIFYAQYMHACVVCGVTFETVSISQKKKIVPESCLVGNGIH